ncbi:hypothetical protein M0805_004250 [Coniferiporia weirii]|nr:hypothetical protein M0805_004250 [Coniferiporia weirii]
MSTSTTAVLERSRPQLLDCRRKASVELSPVFSMPQDYASGSSLATSSPSPAVSGSSLLDVLKPTTVQHRPVTRPLRKSASADSAIVQRNSIQREPVGDAPLQFDASMVQDRGHPHSDIQNLSSPPSSRSLSGLFRSKVSRRRGTSTGTTDNETSAQESDFDKSSATAKVKGRVRARLLSLKSSMTSGSGSEMRNAKHPSSSLPARGTSASLSNLKTSNLSTPRLSPKSSSTLRGPEQAVQGETKRARSQSVGPPSKSTTSKIVKRLSVGNQSTGPEFVCEVAIAVVGPTGCGKSTFIRKSLKRRNLSTAESLMANVTAGDMMRTIAYTCRRARLFIEFNTVTLLSIYEYDTQDWKIDGNDVLVSVWPTGLPPVDGIFVCYDESNAGSFKHVLQLLAGYKSLKMQTMVIACKADLEGQIHPEDAARVVDQYSKIAEVSQYSDEGKSRMRKAVDILVRQIITARSGRHKDALIDTHSLRLERKKIPPLTVQTGEPLSKAELVQHTSPPFPSPARPLPRIPLYPTSVPPSTLALTKTTSASQRSSIRARSMNDILAEHQKIFGMSSYESDRERVQLTISSLSSAAAKSVESFSSLLASAGASPSSPNASEGALRPADAGDDNEQREVRTLPTPWATLDELLEKLFFLAISGDDPPFIAHFFLTYRRFATPRSVLLGMQKRMNELRQPCGDVTLACFAQMRLCNLLEQWMKDYPSDFAVPGTYGALNAFVRHLLSHSHTLSYGSDFLPFLEALPALSDNDAAWALKADEFAESDNETDSVFDTTQERAEIDFFSPPSISQPKGSASEPASSPRAAARERRSSLPLSAMALIKTPLLSTTWYQRADEQNGPSAKEIVARLQKVAAALALHEADAIAGEITRRELELFLKIERRDWLRHSLIPGKKDPNFDPISKFNNNYNELHEWAVSLVLSHDKPKGRARQIEKLVEIAVRLRMLNNYSGLRAIITAINQATYPGDQSMELFKTKVDLHKKFLSSDILLQTTRAHQSYRMALKNTKGPCIPSLEVHTSDLHRANEGNPDTKPDNPLKINWAKYNMIGRFVATTTALQQRCCGPDGYKLSENKYIGQLFDVPVMSYEMQQERIAQPADDGSAPPGPGVPTNSIGNHSKEASVIKRILPW